MWLSKLIYTLLTLLCFWLQWDYTPTPLQAQTQTQTYRQAGKHFYKKGTLPPFQTLHFEILGLILSNDGGWSSYFYSQRYFSRLWIMTFITQTLLLSNTELCFLYTTWPVLPWCRPCPWCPPRWPPPGPSSWPPLGPHWQCPRPQHSRAAAPAPGLKHPTIKWG